MELLLFIEKLENSFSYHDLGLIKEKKQSSPVAEESTSIFKMLSCLMLLGKEKFFFDIDNHIGLIVLKLLCLEYRAKTTATTGNKDIKNNSQHLMHTVSKILYMYSQ
jgi:hypothetical protein